MPQEEANHFELLNNSLKSSLSLDLLNGHVFEIGI